MAKDCKTIYGWDENKAEETRITNMGLQCMRKNQSPMSAENAGQGKPASDSSDMTDIDAAKP